MTINTKAKPGPKPSYTTEEIRNVIGEIWATGARPEVEGIRKVLLARGIGKGSRGDSLLTTIRDTLEAYEEERSREAIERLPGEIARSFDDALGVTAQRLLSALGQGYQQLEARVEKRVELARRDTSFRDEKIADLVGSIETQRDELRRERDRVEELEASLASKDEEIAVLREQVLTLKASSNAYVDMIAKLGLVTRQSEAASTVHPAC